MKIYIVKKILLILILTLSFQSLVKSDDIKDFEIEGISIGDSTLDYFTLSEIKQNTWDYYKNKEFTPLQFDNPSFAQTYDAIDIRYLTTDKNYIIQSLSGIILYRDKNKIGDCLNQMDNILNDVRSIFSNLYEIKKKTSAHSGTNDGGKSKVTSVHFEFENRDSIGIQCYDYSEVAGDVNHLRVSANTYNYRLFLSTKAYK